MKEQLSANKPDLQQLNKHIDKLFIESLKVSSPIHMVYLIREKMNDRGYQQPDKGDILSELGQLQRTMGKLNSEMLKPLL